MISVRKAGALSLRFTRRGRPPHWQRDPSKGIIYSSPRDRTLPRRRSTLPRLPTPSCIVTSQRSTPGFRSGYQHRLGGQLLQSLILQSATISLSEDPQRTIPAVLYLQWRGLLHRLLVNSRPASGGQFQLDPNGNVLDTYSPVRTCQLRPDLSMMCRRTDALRSQLPEEPLLLLRPSGDAEITGTGSTAFSCSVIGGLNGGTLNCHSEGSTQAVLFCADPSHLVYSTDGSCQMAMVILSPSQLPPRQRLDRQCSHDPDSVSS